MDRIMCPGCMKDWVSPLGPCRNFLQHYECPSCGKVVAIAADDATSFEPQPVAMP